jgi:hypothetical protein
MALLGCDTSKQTEVCFCFGETYGLHLLDERLSLATSLVYSSALKMEVRSFDLQVNFYQTTGHHIPDNSTFFATRIPNLVYSEQFYILGCNDI